MVHRNINNILSFGGVAVGDIVEYICITATFELLHGNSTVLYACNAYVELANEMIVDGFDDFGEDQIVIVVNSSIYPRPIQKKVCKNCLSKIQGGGSKLHDPFRRVFSILGKPIGLVLEDSNGKVVYKKAYDVPNPSRYTYRKKKQVNKQIIPDLPTKQELTKTKRLDSWRDIMRNEYKASARAKKILEPEEIPTIEEDDVDLRKVIPNLGIIEPEVWTV